MSVKFQKETVREGATVAPNGGYGGPDGGIRGQDPGFIGSDGGARGQDPRFRGPDGGARGQDPGFGGSAGGARGPDPGFGGQQGASFRAQSTTVREEGVGGFGIGGGATATDGKHRGVKHEFVHELGERLTGGETTKGYLAAYLKLLHDYPLRTKMLTSGTLAALQEVLASWIANDKSKHGHYLSPRVPKMAIYGAFVSAPLGDLLITILQKVFKNRTSLKAKVFQILLSNLIVAPIQNTVYLIAMAIIAGARTIHQIRATVRAGFMPVMKVSWISSPIALAFAQQFLPEQTWVPFFNIVAFVIGTYINAHTKKKRLTALRKKYYDGRSTSGRTDEYSRRDY